MNARAARLWEQAGELPDRYEPAEDDDLLLYAREVTDEHIERANAAYDAWLHARDAEDAAHGGDADAR